MPSGPSGRRLFHRFRSLLGQRSAPCAIPCGFLGELLHPFLVAQPMGLHLLLQPVPPVQPAVVLLQREQVLIQGLRSLHAERPQARLAEDRLLSAGRPSADGVVRVRMDQQDDPVVLTERAARREVEVLRRVQRVERHPEGLVVDGPAVRVPETLLPGVPHDLRRVLLALAVEPHRGESERVGGGGHRSAHGLLPALPRRVRIDDERGRVAIGVGPDGLVAHQHPIRESLKVGDGQDQVDRVSLPRGTARAGEPGPGPFDEQARRQGGARAVRIGPALEKQLHVGLVHPQGLLVLGPASGHQRVSQQKAGNGSGRRPHDRVHDHLPAGRPDQPEERGEGARFVGTERDRPRDDERDPKRLVRGRREPSDGLRLSDLGLSLYRHAASRPIHRQALGSASGRPYGGRSRPSRRVA